jgi:hypothetical protein
VVLVISAILALDSDPHEPYSRRHDLAGTSTSVIRELDQRTSDGISVTLLWNARTNRVFISVFEQRPGAAFEFEVAAADALDAFHHPYAYAEHGRRDGALAA